MLLRRPDWVTEEIGPEGEFFKVVQERRLPSSFAFWRGDVRRRIFERGDFPWEELINDLPGRFFGSYGGELPRRASSCRFVDRAISYQSAEPVYSELYVEGEQQLVPARLRGAPRLDGVPQLVVPHAGHRIVRVAWCSSIEIELRAWPMRPEDVTDFPGAVCFRPRFRYASSIARYVLVFWDIPFSS